MVREWWGDVESIGVEWLGHLPRMHATTLFAEAELVWLAACNSTSQWPKKKVERSSHSSHLRRRVTIYGQRLVKVKVLLYSIVIFSGLVSATSSISSPHDASQRISMR